MKRPTEYKLQKNGKYKYMPKKKVMFNKNIESIFETHSQAIKSVEK